MALRRRGPRTILVTGGTGTLGSDLVRRFASAGDATVVVLTRGVSPSAPGAPPPGLSRLTGDLRVGPTLGIAPGNHAALRASVTDIVHCAADTVFNRPLA